MTRHYTIHVSTPDYMEKSDLVALVEHDPHARYVGARVDEIQEELLDSSGSPFESQSGDVPGWAGAGADVEAQRG